MVAVEFLQCAMRHTRLSRLIIKMMTYALSYLFKTYLAYSHPIPFKFTLFIKEYYFNHCENKNISTSGQILEIWKSSAEAQHIQLLVRKFYRCFK